MTDWIQAVREKRDRGWPPGFWLEQRLRAKVEGSWEGGGQAPPHPATAQMVPPPPATLIMEKHLSSQKMKENPLKSEDNVC